MKRILLSFTILSLASTALAGDPAISSATAPCSGNEEWSFSATVPSAERDRFERLLSGKSSPALAYAQAYALERSGTSNEARIFGAYWKSRALLAANLDHAAWDGMVSIAQATLQRDTYGVQAAALACLNHLRVAHPGLPMARAVTTQLPQYLRLARNADDRKAAWDFADSVLHDQVLARATPSELNSTLGMLRGGDAAEAFAKGMAAASRGDHARTISALEKWLKGSSPALAATESLEKQVPHARLLLGRAYYAQGKWDLAAEQFGLVDPKSNEIAEALSEKAWAHLMAGKYADAVGAATSLEAGAMKNTYAPEAEMVMAMSLNELCQYPDSLRAVKLVKRSYDPTLGWLRHWASRGADSRAPLYPMAVSYLKKQDGGSIPDRLGTEWIRDNRFIALQQEISALFRETDSAAEFRKAVAAERAELNEKVRDLAADANVGVREDRGVLRLFGSAGGKANAELQAKVQTFNLLGEAFAEWENGATARARGLGDLQKRMVAEINRDLAARSQRMLAQLEDVRQNTQLIQVEILQGASHDMVWSNAHPDASKVEADKVESKIDSYARTLRFGHVDPKEIERNAKVELWDDEVGAFKANLNDNCSSKSKYLALRESSSKTKKR